MTRRIVTAREQYDMLAPWLREATPWRSKPGDPTYTVPTGDLLQHRQFNPAITTPEQYRDSVWTDSYDPDEKPYRNNFTNSWSSGGGSEGSNEEDIVEGIEQGKKLPPVEIVTNGVGATLSDGNHRTEVADMMSKPDLESYIHYAPHNPDSFFQNKVDPNSALGQHIDKLVQNHPYEPVDGGPTTDFVFRKHPETGKWQRGRVTDSSPHYVDTPEYHDEMIKKVPHFKPSGLGNYFDVDWGTGRPEITHERHLYARRFRLGMSDVYDEYAGHHQSPGPGTGFPIHDMTGDDYGGGLGGVPEDWYTHPHYYNSGETSKADTRAVSRVYNQVRGNPEAPVDVYRALPHGNETINKGDWVTPSLEYARQHAMHPDDPAQDLPVIKMTVPAKHLYQNGDSYYEMGYHGPTGRAKRAKSYSAAMEDDMVTLYSKPACPQCTATKKQLEKHGIPHQVRDLSTDPEAHAFVTNLGYLSAPVVHAGGDNHWSGFRPDRIKALAG
jgi:glutaredoxin-like protein NrdH